MMVAWSDSYNNLRPVNPLLEQIVVLPAALGFFLLTLTENFSAPHDSIGYMTGIIGGETLVHQHHLFYHYSAHYWLVLMQGLFPTIKDYYLIESFTALWGAGSISVVFAMLRRRFLLPITTAALGSMVVMFSYGVWFYSVNVEVYATPLFFVLSSLYVLSGKNFSGRHVWIVSILHSLAILYHQISILLTVVVLYRFWMVRQQLPLWRSVSTYAIIGLVLVGTSYFYIGWVVEKQNSFAAWWRWMQGYTRHDAYWHPISLSTPYKVAVGFARAFVGGHFFFQLPLIHDYINQSLGDHALHDELFLARNITKWEAILLALGTCVLFFIMMLMLARSIRVYKKLSARTTLVDLAVICFLSYSLFFIFWMPEILEFWILQSVLFWIFVIGALSTIKFPFRIPLNSGLFFLACLVLCVNYFGSIRWLRSIKNDWYYTRVDRLQPVATNRDLIVLQDPWILKDFLVYFTSSSVYEAPWTDSSRLHIDSAVAAALSNGGRVFVYPEQNSKYVIPPTRYIDSLLANSSTKKVLHEKNPVIWVIPPGR